MNTFKMYRRAEDIQYVMQLILRALRRNDLDTVCSYMADAKELFDSFNKAYKEKESNND